jgi:UDP-glucose 6-dehydrogenase
MRTGMIGARHVGLVSGVCSAGYRIDVRIVDTDAANAAGPREGQTSNYERVLDKLVADNASAGFRYSSIGRM